MEVIIFRWSHTTLFLIAFSGRQQTKYCIINYCCIINLLLNSRKISRWKSSFSPCNLALSSAFVNWAEALCTFLSAFPLLLTHGALLSPVCCSKYLPMDFGCLRVQQRAMWAASHMNSSCQVPLSHQSPVPEQQCSPVALLGSSASSSQESSSKQEKPASPAALLLLYHTGDHMKGLFPLFKGLLLLMLHCLWRAGTELETCPGQRDIPNTPHFIVSLSQ